MLVETHIRYLENLKKTSDENIRALDDWPSTITLRQTIDELLEIGMVKNKMPDTMARLRYRAKSVSGCQSRQRSHAGALQDAA